MASALPCSSGATAAVSSPPELSAFSVEPFYQYLSAPTMEFPVSITFELKNHTNTYESINFKIRTDHYPEADKIAIGVSEKDGIIRQNKRRTIQFTLTRKDPAPLKSGRVEIELYLAWMWTSVVDETKKRLGVSQDAGSEPFDWWRKIKCNVERLRLVVTPDGEQEYWADTEEKVFKEDFLANRKCILRMPFPPTREGEQERIAWEDREEKRLKMSNQPFEPVIITNRKLPFDPHKKGDVHAFQVAEAQKRTDISMEIRDLMRRDLTLLSGLTTHGKRLAESAKAVNVNDLI